MGERNYRCQTSTWLIITNSSRGSRDLKIYGMATSRQLRRYRTESNLRNWNIVLYVQLHTKSVLKQDNRRNRRSKGCSSWMLLNPPIPNWRHRSSPSQRRMVHFHFTSTTLNCGQRWYKTRAWYRAWPNVSTRCETLGYFRPWTEKLILTGRNEREGSQQNVIHFPPWLIPLYKNAIWTKERHKDVSTSDGRPTYEDKWQFDLVYLGDIVIFW